MHDAIQHWSTYLNNCASFDVVTDHYALVYLVTKPIRDSNGRLMRYIMDIQQYSFAVIHRKGGSHLDADAVSRLLRYDDEMLRILNREQLVEDGPVTKKDQEDLKEYMGIDLPYAGIDRVTKETLLDDLYSRKNRWGPKEQQTMNMIKLRHEMEMLLNISDDDLDCLDGMEE